MIVILYFEAQYLPPAVISLATLVAWKQVLRMTKKRRRLNPLSYLRMESVAFASISKIANRGTKKNEKWQLEPGMGEQYFPRLIGFDNSFTTW